MGGVFGVKEETNNSKRDWKWKCKLNFSVIVFEWFQLYRGMLCENEEYYSLPNDKIFDLSKFKAFADDNLNVYQKLKFALGRVANIVGKEKMLVTSIFSFSHNVSKRPICQGHLK